MDTRLSHELSQKLVLSPQIRQYLKLLQMPVVELQNAVNEFLAENPVVEMKSEDPVIARPEDSVETSPQIRDQGRPDTHEVVMGKAENLVTHAMDVFPEDRDTEDYGADTPEELQKSKDYQDSTLVKKQGLADFLSWQIRFLDLTENEIKLAEQIIGNLNDHGFLVSPIEELASTCGSDVETAEEVLLKLQDLDPAGVCARNLQECLLLQLKRLQPPNDLAMRIVKDAFALLAKHDWPTIARIMNETPEQVQAACEVIAKLDPKPGKNFENTDALNVVPDVTVSFDDQDPDQLKVELRHEYIPQLKISAYYRKLLREKNTDEQTKQFVREKIQSATNFMNAMQLRGSTLENISKFIVRAQADFFTQGFAHLKPLRLKDAAEELKIHESSVSRAISGKYMATPMGVIPMRRFFSSKLETHDGESESQTSMMHKVRDLIQSEDPSQPLSDQAIVAKLQEQGIKLARRTVTKYRELLRILPSHLRRRHLK